MISAQKMRKINNQESQHSNLPTFFIGTANSPVFSRLSPYVGNEGKEAPISFRWQDHQLAFYATLNSDITPRGLDPPIPWDDPFPDYLPFRWQPSSSQIPAWQMTVGEASPNTLEMKRVSSRVPSVESTGMTAIYSSPTRSEELRNPEGRVGIAGKGLLPQYGGNTACIVVVERSGFSDVEEVLLLRGVRAQAQFPWFLCRHGKNCSQISCYKDLVREYCEQLIIANGETEMYDSAGLQRLLAAYNKYTHLGPVSDPINCDNAWLEATAVHFKIVSPFPSICSIEQMFTIKGGVTMWARLDDLPSMRKAHLVGLEAIHID
ncbi:unnamed protein product [Hydatigera taeniaeformis]|uniref:Cauli_VI domain-containing protein n=1 Tax=Hydatigena taeniaeformis TaxID=6205 RepID=A0A0R3WQP4_HYDTA|nr:unnamed protein product [Hydatigera taeniaeformis]